MSGRRQVAMVQVVCVYQDWKSGGSFKGQSGMGDTPKITIFFTNRKPLFFTFSKYWEVSERLETTESPLHRQKCTKNHQMRVKIAKIREIPEFKKKSIFEGGGGAILLGGGVF